MDDDEAAKTFPKMPQDVLDTWIRAYIPNFGLPFSKDTWQQHFCALHFRYWATLNWELQRIDPSPHFFSYQTEVRVRWIIGNAAFGLKTPTANLEDTRERFWAAAAFFKKHGKLPGTPIIGDMFNRLRLVDGHHRLAALWHIGFASDLRIPVWVGTV